MGQFLPFISLIWLVSTSHYASQMFIQIAVRRPLEIESVAHPKKDLLAPPFTLYPLNSDYANNENLFLAAPLYLFLRDNIELLKSGVELKAQKDNPAVEEDGEKGWN